jgi:glycine cleavage system aminomethyltransferase T
MIARTGYTGEDGFEIVLPARRPKAVVALRAGRASAAALARATRCGSKPA